jgi:hypothetical protein
MTIYRRTEKLIQAMQSEDLDTSIFANFEHYSMTNTLIQEKKNGPRTTALSTLIPYCTQCCICHTTKSSRTVVLHLAHHPY